MNLKILDSWLREYLQTKARPTEISQLLSLSGPSVEHLDKVNHHDYSYDLEITTNRIDMACVIGIAREANAALRQQGITSAFNSLNVKKPKVPARPKLTLTVKDPEHLSRKIMALALTNVEVGPSSKVVQQRLKVAGVRSINNLIDITNYIMLETGHPAHIFDYHKIKTKTLLFRYAKNGEEIVTLDSQKHQLTSADVVIDDGTGRIIDLPGIMGAKNSMVDEQTKTVVLFLEMNNPVQIRRTSMKTGIRTMAATYNENSPDEQTAELCFYRGVSLLQSWAKAKIASNLVNISRLKTKPKTLTLPLASLESYLGQAFAKKQVISILADLGFGLKKQSRDKLVITVPAFRHKDINLVEDLVEEVGRIYGYHRFSSQLPPFVYYRDTQLLQLEKLYEQEKIIRAFLSHRGAYELLSYSMLSKQYHQYFANQKMKAIKMNNPLSEELVYFRQTLLAGLVKAALINKHQADLSLFEIGPVYLPQHDDLPKEQLNLALLNTRSYWQLKGQIEALMHYGNCLNRLSFKQKAVSSYFDTEKSATVYLDNVYLGEVGLLSPKIARALKINKPLYLAEVHLSVLAKYLEFLQPIVETKHQNILIEDLTYRFNGRNYYSQIVESLLKQFKRISKIQYQTRFKDFYTIRIYTQTSHGQSILGEIIQYLQKQFNLEIKGVTADSNKLKKV